MGAILNYLIYTQKNKTILGYLQRRWDIYHTLSSTYHALWLGLIVGIFFRICFWIYFVLHISFLELILSSPELTLIADFCKTYEFCYLLFICVGVILLLGLFYKGRQTLMTEYQPIYNAIFINIDFKNGDLKYVFQDYFKP